ncbi:MAG: tetratricopeptide repeat protein [Myxococcota bacterium]
MRAVITRIVISALTLVGCAGAMKLSTAQRADALRREGRLAEAYAAYAGVLCDHPGNGAQLDAARHYVETWHDLGQPGAPQARLEDCNLDPTVQAYVDGLVAGASGDIEAAHVALARAETTVAVAARGEVAYRRGLLDIGRNEPRLAQAHFDRAAGLEPERPEIRLALAQSLLDQARYDDAIAALRGLLAIETTRFDLDRARRIFRTAVKRSEPPLPDGVAQPINEILSALERGENAPGALERSQNLAAEVDHPRVLIVAGLVALQRGLKIEAGQFLNRAAMLNPIDPEPPRVLGTARYAAERPAEALAPLREAMRRDPFDVEVARMVATAAIAIEDTETARDTYRALIVLEPQIAEHYLWLARTERRLGRFGAARRAVERGCALDARNVLLLLELASVEMTLALSAPTAVERVDARQRAQSAVDQLLEVAPGHPGAVAILASLES